jgi:Sulfotransferase family
MQFGSRTSSIPGLAPPPVLIFFHIPKTGGITMKVVVQHCLPDEHFDCDLDVPDTALCVRSTARIAEKFHQLPVERQRAVRCMVGDHVTMDVAKIFDRPSKFFTIVRAPVDRVISSFFFSRTLHDLPSHRFIKNMTLEEYLDSRISGLRQPAGAHVERLSRAGLPLEI